MGNWLGNSREVKTTGQVPQERFEKVKKKLDDKTQALKNEISRMTVLLKPKLSLAEIQNLIKEFKEKWPESNNQEKNDQVYFELPEQVQGEKYTLEIKIISQSEQETQPLETVLGKVDFIIKP